MVTRDSFETSLVVTRDSFETGLVVTRDSCYYSFGRIKTSNYKFLIFVQRNRKSYLKFSKESFSVQDVYVPNKMNQNVPNFCVNTGGEAKVYSYLKRRYHKIFCFT